MLNPLSAAPSTPDFPTSLRRAPALFDASHSSRVKSARGCHPEPNRFSPMAVRDLLLFAAIKENPAT
jgi:hypothetical protein